MHQTQNLHVKSAVRLLTPRALKNELPISERSNRTVVAGREAVSGILQQEDARLLVIAGPCSIHDVDAALEYGRKLSAVRREVSEQMEVVMRVYFEKPRTTIGWKGLVNDPHLDGSYDIDTGLKRARKLLLDLTAMGLPTATEFLDPIVPQYIDDLVTWAAIGARTIESQTHREMASGLSMPIGFKNGTDGTLQTALNAMRSARQPHHFLGVDGEGRVAIVATTGTQDTPLVLRGGAGGPNYEERHVRAAADALRPLELCPRIMVDCSHDNSSKDYRRQPEVAADLAAQVRRGASLLGAMIESNLVAGKQPFPPPSAGAVRYGQSITDGCVDLPTTSRMLDDLAAAVDSAH